MTETVSEVTRSLVASASIARDKMLANLKARVTAGEVLSDIAHDVIVTRIALALKATADLSTKADDRQNWEHFVPGAELIYGKRNWTKTALAGDDLRTKAEQDLFAAADKWLSRAFADIDVSTGETRGRKARTPSTDAPKSDAPIVAPPAPQVDAPQAFSIPKMALPKASVAPDLSAILAFLSQAASKALAEAASITGDDAMLARDALSSIVKAHSDYTAAIDAARKAEDKPKRAAVIALAKAHATPKVPALAELN